MRMMASETQRKRGMRIEPTRRSWFEGETLSCISIMNKKINGICTTLTEWLTLAQEPHVQAAPCLLGEQAPQEHPFPWVEKPPTTAEDFPVVTTLRLVNVEAGVNAATAPMVEMADTVAAVRRTILLCYY